MIVGVIELQIVVAVVFGVVFLTAMLVFATKFVNPSPFQIQVFVTTLALAAAGVGAVIPGLIIAEVKDVVRAGGAMALFVVVYFFRPQLIRATTTIEFPHDPPEPLANEYLRMIDNGLYEEAWQSLTAEGRLAVGGSRDRFFSIYKNQRTPMGKTLRRTIVGSNTVQSPPGAPVGAYLSLVFNTKYESFGDECWTEVVTMRAGPDKKWHVFNHNLLQQVPCVN